MENRGPTRSPPHTHSPPHTGGHMTDTTRQRILDAARRQFLDRGYHGTSIRSIAREIGLTSTALYRHFANKEEIFAALVDPELEMFRRIIESRYREYLESLERGEPKPMWPEDESNIEELQQMLFANEELFRLVFLCSEGTRYAQTLDWLVDREVEMTGEYLRALHEHGYEVNTIEEPALRRIVKAHYESLVKVLEVPGREAAVRYLLLINRFFVAGWKELILGNPHQTHIERRDNHE